MGWRPLGVRGNAAATESWEGPHEGIPIWLRSSVLSWFSVLLREEYPSASGRHAVKRAHLVRLERELHLSLNWTNEETAFDSATNLLMDDEIGPRILDWCLTLSKPEFAAILDQMLTEGHSAWCVGLNEANEMELQRRVDATVRDAVQSAAPSGSRAATHLAKAWSDVYGMDPDPASSFRESVRAVEAAAKPVVEPGNAAATLGTMIPVMRAKPSKWTSTLSPTAGDPVLSIATMMELIWKSQLDRHGTDDTTKPPYATREEAEAALHIAASLVHLFSSGALTRNP